MKIVNHHGNKDNKFDLINEEFLVALGISFEPSKRRVKSLYEELLMQKGRIVFEKRVQQHSLRLGVKPGRIIIKNMKSRWGSATKDNIINLNANLLKAPEDVIDCVALHEVCHLKIKEHSRSFWDLMRRFMPNYHEKINWLKANGGSLF